MSSIHPLYFKANKVRTTLLLFVDKEIHDQKKKEIKENKPVLTKAKSANEKETLFFVEEEVTFAYKIEKEEFFSRKSSDASSNTSMKASLKSNKNISNIKVFNKRYSIKNFYLRDSTICFISKKDEKEDIHDYSKYLEDLIKNLKKQKVKRKKNGISS